MLLFLEVFMKRLLSPHQFNRFEKGLWMVSVLAILLSYALFDRGSPLTLAASLIGVTSLIFSAVGNPVGQFLMVVFSLLYGVISWSFAYYGEMLTYLGMTGPMALVALISWLRHPFQGNAAQVRVDRLRRWEWPVLALLTAAVTAVFYFILAWFDTTNLELSTLSVSTSFAAVYLTARRSPFYGLAYAANDVVLILLWALAAMADQSYLSVMICFWMFLFNDLYGFFSWRKLEQRQAN